MRVAPLLPLGDRLKVLPLKRPERTKSGIVLPETSEARDRPSEGIVLAVGIGRRIESGAMIALESQPGDVVQFGKYAGVVVFDEAVGFDVLLMREDEALGRKRKRDLPKAIPGDPRSPVDQEDEARARGETALDQLDDDDEDAEAP